jgi:mannose-6-phosphate isomerase-like protein (cupin superfamily)
MSASLSRHPALPELWQAHLEGCGPLNAAIVAALAAVRDDPQVRRTHHFHGRFENTYVPAELIPAAQPLFDWVLAQARQVLGRDDLRYGFWFNEMGPGQRTSLHSHEEADELLSAVYYLQVPPDSGRLVLWDGDRDVRCTPQEGLLLMFPPQLPHEVEPNRSDGTRLSVAFNFGPREADAD